MLAERQVRRLRVRGQESLPIPRVKTLLEEAIRTASLPNIPANGVICIRRLNLGRINVSTNSQFISRRLDQLVRNLALTEITVENPECDDADVVWFADMIEPYRRLSELLASGRSARAWYWPAVVPGWAPSMNLPESCLLCVSQLAQKSTAITGLSYALEPFVQAGTMFGILQKIRPEVLSTALTTLPMAAPALLVESVPRGKPASIAAEADRIEVRLANEWKLFLRQSLKCWPASDARLRLAFNLVLNVAGMQPNKVNAGALLRAILPQDLPDLAICDTAPPLSHRDFIAENAPVDTNQPEPDGEGLDTGRVESDMNRDDGIKLSPEPDKATQESQSLKSQQPVPPGATAQRRLRSASVPKQVSTLADQSTPIPGQYLLRGNYAGEISSYGGFLFLIPLMYRLGMAELMENDGGAADPQLLQRLLWRIADWLEIPANDPVRQFLGESLPPPKAYVSFVAPWQWRLLLGLETDTILELIRVNNQPGIRLLRDPRSRLVLGLWRPGDGRQMRAWLDKFPTRTGSASIASWTQDDLVTNLVVAMCRYVRRYSRLSMRGLVRRSANIAITRTHLDWSASLEMLDIRVRMAGLDVDPGWVPWLQRVISFHYIDKEQ